jgi:hypothetical protein
MGTDCKDQIASLSLDPSQAISNCCEVTHLCCSKSSIRAEAREAKKSLPFPLTQRDWRLAKETGGVSDSEMESVISQR